MHAGFGRLKEKNVQAQVGPQMDCVFDRVVQMRPGGYPPPRSASPGRDRLRSKTARSIYAQP